MFIDSESPMNALRTPEECNVLKDAAADYTFHSAGVGTLRINACYKHPTPPESAGNAAVKN